MGGALAQSLPSLGDVNREELSPAVERRLGEQIMRDIRRNRDFIDDAPIQDYLNNLGNNLAATRPDLTGEVEYGYQFFAVRDSMLNAFALPGGFIGVYSGLLLAAQTESELASVLAHEIGHVSQRHLARMLGKQRQDLLIPLASAVLAALAAQSSPDASAALLLGGQGAAMQRQLNFSRDAEREADRVGLEILRESGFETTSMVSFFGRVQNATRAYTDAAPAYLRSHPLTTERMADIQARTRNMPRKLRTDSLDFQLVKSRSRVLQSPTARGLSDVHSVFNEQVRQKDARVVAGGQYGLAMIALMQGLHDKASKHLHESQSAAGAVAESAPMLVGLEIDILLAANQANKAVERAQEARNKFSGSRALARLYADALMAAGRYDQAVSYLRDQTQMYRDESQLQQQLARAYAGQGKQALQHLALAEAYALQGALPAALDQINIARGAQDATYYELAVIDAREREFKARRLEELRQKEDS